VELIRNKNRTGRHSHVTLSALALVLALLFASPRVVSGHAEVETASPPVGGNVTALPASMVLTFTEEVRPGAVSVQVTGPDGSRVDAGDAAVDLTDPERITVRVSLFAGGPGEYLVHWETISNADGDSASGDYTFTVNAREAASPSVSVTTPDATESGPVPTATAENFGNPLAGTDGDFDSRAFAISVGAGLLALAAIVAFWFMIRPRNPKFGPRAGPPGSS
jgi:methionine-rich copper-binding protein CopC